MDSKPRRRNGKLRNVHQPVDRRASQQLGLERLSAMLEDYSAAAEEGAVEKLSKLAEQIVKFIAGNRSRATRSSYYRRRIE
jgi:hypothetical protein